jgi:hypothetical protein
MFKTSIIDKKCIKIVLVVYEFFAFLNMKFLLYFAHSVCNFVCIGEIFIFIEIYKKIKRTHQFINTYPQKSAR